MSHRSASSTDIAAPGAHHQVRSYSNLLPARPFKRSVASRLAAARSDANGTSRYFVCEAAIRSLSEGQRTRTNEIWCWCRTVLAGIAASFGKDGGRRRDRTYDLSRAKLTLSR